MVLHYGRHVCDYGHDFRLCDQVTSLQNGRDSDLEQIENDFKDPEDGFWDKNNLKSIKSNCEVILKIKASVILLMLNIFAT